MRPAGCVYGALLALIWSGIVWMAAISLIGAVIFAQPFFAVAAVLFALLAWWLAHHALREGRWNA